LANPIADALRNIEPDIAISDVATMEERIDDALAPQRLSLLLVQSFAVIALVVTVVGLYGVIGHGVSKGTPEIGLRMALGASPSRYGTLRNPLRDSNCISRHLDWLPSVLRPCSPLA